MRFKSLLEVTVAAAVGGAAVAGVASVLTKSATIVTTGVVAGVAIGTGVGGLKALNDAYEAKADLKVANKEIERLKEELSKSKGGL